MDTKRVTRIYRQREASSLTQLEIAKRIRVPRPFFTMVERGYKTANPRVRSRIAKILDASVGYLFDERGFALPADDTPPWSASPLDRRIIKLTRAGWSRPRIANELDVTRGRVFQAQRNAGLLPLSRGGGKP